MQDKALIVQSLKVIEVQTKNCIKFVEYTSISSYSTWLLFTQNNGCWSYVRLFFLISTLLISKN